MREQMDSLLNTVYTWVQSTQEAVDAEAIATSAVPHAVTPGTSDWNLKCISSSPLKLRRLSGALRCPPSSTWIFISYTSPSTPNFSSLYIFLSPHPSLFSPLLAFLNIF